MFKRTLYALIIGSMLGATLVGVPAAADPHEGKTRQSGVETPKGPHGEQIAATLRMKADSIPGNKMTQDLTCTAYWSPAPQYSASNNTVHYGIWASCNYVGTFDFKLQIYVKDPSGGGFQPAADPIRSYPTGQFPAAGGFTACFPGSSGQWMAKFWGNSSVTGYFYPYPASSPAPTLPCT